MHFSNLSILLITFFVEKSPHIIFFSSYINEQLQKCSWTKTHLATNKSVWCENELCMHDHCHMGRRNTNEVCVESNYTSSLLVTVVLEMLALIGGAGKCEVCFPPLSPPPPPPPL